jgi:hypothetical protein
MHCILRRRDSTMLFDHLTYTQPTPLLTKVGKVANYPQKDPPGHFYSAWLLHYGLKPMKFLDNWDHLSNLLVWISCHQNEQAVARDSQSISHPPFRGWPRHVLIVLKDNQVTSLNVRSWTWSLNLKRVETWLNILCAWCGVLRFHMSELNQSLGPSSQLEVTLLHTLNECIR